MCWTHGDEWHPAKHKPSRESALCGDSNGVLGAFCAAAALGIPEAPRERSPEEVRGAVCPSVLPRCRWGAPARLCLAVPETPRMEQLLPWAFMKWQEWRELGPNLSILLVLLESCMIFPEEHLKNWTQTHTYTFWSVLSSVGCFLFSDHVPHFCQVSEQIPAITIVPWPFTTAGGEEKAIWSPHHSLQKVIHLEHAEKSVSDPFDSFRRPTLLTCFSSAQEKDKKM